MMLGIRRPSVAFARAPAVRAPGRDRRVTTVTATRKANPWDLAGDVTEIFGDLKEIKERLGRLEGNMNLSMLLSLISTASSAGVLVLMMILNT